MNYSLKRLIELFTKAQTYRKFERPLSAKRLSSPVVTVSCYKMARSVPGKIWSIELDTKPIYLAAKSKLISCGQNGDSSNRNRADEFLKSSPVYYISGFNNTSFARNTTRYERLKSSLSDFKDWKLISGIAFGSNKFERGFFIELSDSSENSPAEEKKLLTFVKKFGGNELLKFCARCEEGEEGIFMEVCHDQVGSGEQIELVEVEAPRVHPAFLSDTNSVYHNMNRVNSVLDDSDLTEEVRELREICGKYIDANAKLPLVAKNPVVVIEGLDATGKTTLTKNLGKALNATVLKSPPECICHLRSKFDSCSQLMRRAFYSLGNYAFAAMIQEASSSGIVIADRFWNSTAAYAIASDVKVGGVGNLPPLEHSVYTWPTDLLKPDIIFLLTITDEERRRRMTKRGSVKTDEEILLEKSRLFGQRLEESYKRMANPSLQVIDASGTETEVLDKTLEILRGAGITGAQ